MVWRAYGWRLTPQPELASTGVLRFGFMPVASPYAVFRAADVIWPPQARPPLEPDPNPGHHRPLWYRPCDRFRGHWIAGPGRRSSPESRG